MTQTKEQMIDIERCLICGKDIGKGNDPAICTEKRCKEIFQYEANYNKWLKTQTKEIIDEIIKLIDEKIKLFRQSYNTHSMILTDDAIEILQELRERVEGEENLRPCPFMYWREFCRCKYHDSASNCTINVNAEKKDAWCHIMVERGIRE